jgi:PHP family Zn ribbon phosphoesterase
VFVEIIADLHLHSKYSRAVSQQMTLSVMTQFAKKKGIGLLTTGDWTHPLWLREIKNQLHEVDQGIYSLKMDDRGLKIDKKEPRFILSVEVSSIYSEGGKTRKIHTLLFVPSIEVAEKFNKKLVNRGVNVTSDGRPIMGLKNY